MTLNIPSQPTSEAKTFRICLGLGSDERRQGKGVMPGFASTQGKKCFGKSGEGCSGGLPRNERQAQSPTPLIQAVCGIGKSPRGHPLEVGKHVMQPALHARLHATVPHTRDCHLRQTPVYHFTDFKAVALHVAVLQKILHPPANATQAMGEIQWGLHGKGSEDFVKQILRHKTQRLLPVLSGAAGQHQQNTHLPMEQAYTGDIIAMQHQTMQQPGPLFCRLAGGQTCFRGYAMVLHLYFFSSWDTFLFLDNLQSENSIRAQTRRCTKIMQDSWNNKKKKC